MVYHKWTAGGPLMEIGWLPPADQCQSDGQMGAAAARLWPIHKWLAYGVITFDLHILALHITFM